jgi:hypothetical protein
MNEMVYDEVWTETAAQIAYYKIRGIDYRQKVVDGSVGRIPAPPKGSALYPAYAKGTKERSTLARKVGDTIADGFKKIESFATTIRGREDNTVAQIIARGAEGRYAGVFESATRPKRNRYR